MNSRHAAAIAISGVLMALMMALVLGTPVSAQTSRATATPTRTPTRTPTPTATATVTATAALILPTPTPPAFILLPAPSVKNQLVGDVVTRPGLLLSGAYPSVFGERIALAMANLRDVSAGPAIGDGIDSVTFTLIDTATGHPIHTRVARGEFCAFEVTYSGCPVLDLAASGYTWPDGTAAHSGHYLLVAFAEGADPEHKGTWTLPFELRLQRDGLQDLDGAARIREIEPREGGGYIVTVETFGFAPLAAGTHLHLYGATSAQGGAPDPSDAVVEYPAEMREMNVGDWSGSVRVAMPATALPRNARALCVAVAHPDHTLLPERGECVALEY